MCFDRNQTDEGDTLIEVLMALVLLAIAAVALMTSIAITLTGSGKHRSFATEDTVLRSAAETIKYDVQLQSTPWFTPCAAVTSSTSGGVTTYYYNGNPITFTIPSGSGYSVQVTGAPLTSGSSGGIEYWNPTVVAGSPVGLSATCSTGWSDHAGFQLIFLKVTGPSSTQEIMAVGVRNPS